MNPDILIDQLAANGVNHLRAVTATQAAEYLTPVELIQMIAQNAEPRIRQALIPLFLRHPDYADYVFDAISALDSSSAQVLRHMYTAAAYLQRLWRGTLGIYLGKFDTLPDLFGQTDFGLPGPEEDFGERGLRTLANLLSDQTGDNWLSAYEGTMALFLKQLIIERDQNGTQLR